MELVCYRHASAPLPPGKGPRTHRIGGWVGQKAGLDGCEKPRPTLSCNETEKGYIPAKNGRNWNAVFKIYADLVKRIVKRVTAMVWKFSTCTQLRTSRRRCMGLAS